MNSIGEVCKGLGEHTPSLFACNLWATADSDELISGEGRVYRQSFVRLAQVPVPVVVACAMHLGTGSQHPSKEQA